MATAGVAHAAASVSVMPQPSLIDAIGAGRSDIELYKIKMAARRLFADTEAAGEGVDRAGELGAPKFFLGSPDGRNRGRLALAAAATLGLFACAGSPDATGWRQHPLQPRSAMSVTPTKRHEQGRPLEQHLGGDPDTRSVGSYPILDLEACLGKQASGFAEMATKEGRFFVSDSRREARFIASPMAVYCSARVEPIDPVITEPVLTPMPMVMGGWFSALRVRLNSSRLRSMSRAQATALYS